MLNYLKTIFKLFGVDRAIFYTSVARIIQALTGVITIFFVARFLSGEEQGFYYTFGSILAIQVFFELGLNGIISQYVAQEASHLHWDLETKLAGPTKHISRLSSLLHLVVKWYSIISGMLFLILLLAGFIFFKKYDTSGGAIIWLFPWLILSLSTTFAFLLNPILAFLEGLGKVKEVAIMRLIQQVLITLMIWAGLLSGTKLYANGIGTIIGILFLFGIIFFSKYRFLLQNIWKVTGTVKINYKEEIFPYQWKIALSWISGYFIFQLFNPVLFATDGAVVAGQMGMTLAAVNGILSLSFSWMSTKVPLFSGLIAQKKYDQLDNIFNRTLIQSVLINTTGLGFLFLAIYFLKYFQFSLGNRFLPYIPLLLLMVPIFLNQFVSSWATYLRCHKKEPMLIISVVSAVVMSLSTIILGKHFGVIGLTSGFCIVSICMFPWAYYIFKTKKILWHGGLLPGQFNKL